MDKKKKAFLERLMVTFQVEAVEHIKMISNGLIQLEKQSNENERAVIIETIYREAHSLKGASRSVERKNIESVCQLLENILRKFKHKGIPSTLSVFDTLHQAMDLVMDIVEGKFADNARMKTVSRELELLESGGVDSLSAGNNLKKSPSFSVDKEARHSVLQQVEKRRSLKKKGAIVPEKSVSGDVGNTGDSDVRTEGGGDSTDALQDDKLPGAFSDETIRLATGKLDAVLRQAEEMIFTKLFHRRLALELSGLQEIADTLPKIPGENFHAQTRLLQLQVRNIIKTLENDGNTIVGMVDSHLEDMKELLMLPFATLTEGFPKTLRDLARDKEKEAELVIRGVDVEIDKRVLETVKAPLIHLLRNAVDHGLELPVLRKDRGKPAAGTVTIELFPIESNKVEIRFADDGAGIDLEKVKDKSIAAGIFSRDQLAKMNEVEILGLIFRSEFSTSPLITDISGRGLGLAIVREKVEMLGGTIALHNRPGLGTEFRIRIPLALATFRGVLVNCGDSRFIVPTMNVERVVRLNKSAIKTVENREVILFNERLISYVEMQAVLGVRSLSQIDTNRDMVQILVLNGQGTRMAFGVDDILNEEEVMVKDLGKQLERVVNVSGAAVLSSSEVVPILNTPDLINSAISYAAGSLLKKTKSKVRDVKSIILVEDSITSRILLKNILESSGYEVEVAVDGRAGWQRLQEREFNMVISDVEMPHMDGFQLTKNIRSDNRLAKTPVILVTCLESREHREKGIEAGADAYIIKSSFDRGNLLDVMKRLL
ncbi:MAG: response regulator [bacterium]|nr:response regulator [bacterium]